MTNENNSIRYIICGDPSIQETINLILKFNKEKVKNIKLGIPFSDPLADGPIIEAANLRAIENGFKINDFFNELKNIKVESTLIIVCYYNSILGFGKENFINLCKEGNIKGIFIQDVPSVERNEIIPDFEKENIHLFLE